MGFWSGLAHGAVMSAATLAALSLALPQDRAGSLRELLYVFEQHRISLTSIHSSRTPAGEVHFRIGFDAGVGLEELRAAAQAIDRSGLGRVLEQP